MYNRLHKAEKPLSAKTIQNLHGVVHKALQQAVEIGYIKFNPSDACKLPRIEKKEIKPLDEQEIALFLNAVQGHPFERIYIVDIFTGMRQGEILGLSWDCIDFDKGTILIYRQLEKVEGVYQFGSLKNGKTRRITPAPSVMKVLLEQ
ncbi:tyrosine-type recombinase/integrase [Ethanoligenens sp.]|uniref:tyrosine-type recombinase/integrase n=1 Tax=Ethanoligenens sp. TaxID=2099655 RepID=UPI0039ED354E